MEATVIRGSAVEVTLAPWGSVQWLVCGKAGTSRHMTLGRVTIKPGQANPMHVHPNCEEILFVAQGDIEHALPQGGAVRLAPGDCIVVPANGPHQARNVGQTEAVVVVAFSSPDRQTLNE